MTKFKLDGSDLNEILRFIKSNPNSFETRFFKTIERFIRDEQSAREDYTRMEEALEDIGAPEPLIKIFRHLKIDEREHWETLMSVELLKRHT